MSYGDLSETSYSRIVLSEGGLTVELLMGDEDDVVLRIWHDEIPSKNSLELRNTQINMLRGMIGALGFEAT